jgi:RNA polymerase sigma-70 factor (ECF subfamily)
MEQICIDDFNSLYAKYGPMVLRRCKKLLKDEDSALDAMQDVFVRVMERRHAIASVCVSYFYTVATSVCLNKLRAAKLRSGPSADALLDFFPDTKTAFHEEITDTSLFLQYLFESDDDTRCMATFHYVDGLTLEETARIVGMSVSGVRKRLGSLRRKALTSIGV